MTERAFVRMAVLGAALFLSRGSAFADPPEPMSADSFLSEFSAGIADQNSEQFVPLTAPNAYEAHFRSLSSALLNNNLAAASSETLALDSAGVRYKLVEITGVPAAGPVYGFLERVAPGNADYRGWGAMLVRPSARGRAILEAPHVRADWYTERIALDGFLENPKAAAVLFAGAHRYANADHDGDGVADSDPAHDPDTLFHALTVYLAGLGAQSGAPYWFVQIHASQDRDGEPTIVGSNGSDAPALTAADPLVRIDDAVDAAGHVTMGVWGWRESAAPEEDGDYLLKATTNIQGDFLETLGLRKTFFHFEIERHARDDYAAGTGPGYLGIRDLLDAIGSVLPSGPQPVSSTSWTLYSFRSQESGVRSQESGVRSQKSGVRSQKSGVRIQNSEG